MGLALPPPHPSPPFQREAFIDAVVSMLELGPIAGKLCSSLSGGEVRRGSAAPTRSCPAARFPPSLPQRKLLTVGVELAANPSVLFLDEPTTGLSYKSAAVLMRVLQVGWGQLRVPQGRGDRLVDPPPVFLSSAPPVPPSENRGLGAHARRDGAPALRGPLLRL